jgi:hypothetical protein
MKVLGLGLIVGGWLIAVGGLLASEATAMRLAIAVVGLGTSLAGIATLNGACIEHAPWKARGHRA